jgi:hypothetical protein
VEERACVAGDWKAAAVARDVATRVAVKVFIVIETRSVKVDPRRYSVSEEEWSQDGWSQHANAMVHSSHCLHQQRTRGTRHRQIGGRGAGTIICATS